jgi:hypothetical protein
VPIITPHRCAKPWQYAWDRRANHGCDRSVQSNLTGTAPAARKASRDDLRGFGVTRSTDRVHAKSRPNLTTTSSATPGRRFGRSRVIERDTEDKTVRRHVGRAEDVIRITSPVASNSPNLLCSPTKREPGVGASDLATAQCRPELG